MFSEPKSIEPRLEFRPGLDFSRVREEFVRAYQPSGPEEMILVEQIARAWLRLQMYYDFEAQLVKKQALAELFETDFERFKALNRAVTGAERMWREAIRVFQAARRRSALSTSRSERRAATGRDQKQNVPAAPPAPASSAAHVNNNGRWFPPPGMAAIQALANAAQPDARKIRRQPASKRITVSGPASESPSGRRPPA